MKTIKIILLYLSLMVFGSCSLYQAYEPSTSVSTDIMGDAVSPQDTSSLGNIGWRQLFTDPLLQQLIERAMVNNADIKTAQLNIEQAQNDLTTAQLGHLPILSFEPSGGLRRFNSVTTRSYAIPVTASWQLSIFGQVASKKRQIKAQREMYNDYKQAVQANLAANIAATYYSLVILDRKLQILQETQDAWETSLETMQTLYEAGLYQSPAVYQMEASLTSVQSGIVELQENILTTESALCLLLSETPHHIQRSPFGAFQIPDQLQIGIPLRLLSARPDVRQAERNMEIAFYNTQQAQQAFYPDITISGSLGWSNDNGLVNPARFLTEAIASLTQPLFAQGKIRTRYKNAKIEQEKARIQFVQTLLTAGNEVYVYLHTCHKAKQKVQYIDKMVNALNEAYIGTRELLNNGTNTYVEVIKAQEDLLNTQLRQVENTYDGIQAFINLYTALGGF